MANILTQKQIDAYRKAEAALRDAMTGPIDCDRLNRARVQMARIEESIRCDRDGRVPDGVKIVR